MLFSSKVDQLVEALRCLPGVGPKSAQRMALHLLQSDRNGAAHLAKVLHNALEQVGHCLDCRILTDSERCDICSDSRREADKLCIVETSADLLAIEKTASYRGLYFILMGHLSPIDGIGPEQIGLPQLLQRVTEGVIKEVIIATNPTVEGEATAHYISEQLAAYNITISRIAHGVPLGEGLEYVDGGTLSRAMNGRQKVTANE